MRLLFQCTRMYISFSVSMVMQTCGMDAESLKDKMVSIYSVFICTFIGSNLRVTFSTFRWVPKFLKYLGHIFFTCLYIHENISVVADYSRGKSINKDPFFTNAILIIGLCKNIYSSQKVHIYVHCTI